MRTWLVTGASRGFGRTISDEALRRGDRVVAAARTLDHLDDLVAANPERVLPVAMDVTDDAAVRTAVDKAAGWTGTIDVLVNNAGYGIHGAVEEVDADETAKIFDVNVFGLLRVTRAILPIMRKQRSGHIVNISSLAGLVGGAGSGIYASTKFAVEGLSEAMMHEVRPLGIRVTLIEPGPFRTDFNGSSIQIARAKIADYDATAGERGIALRAASGKQPGDPKRVAEIICDVVESSEPPLHLPLGNPAVERVGKKLAALNKELNKWEPVSRSADFGAAG